ANRARSKSTFWPPRRWRRWKAISRARSLRCSFFNRAAPNPSASCICTISSKPGSDRSVKARAVTVRGSAKKIRLLLLDVDGVLPDGRIILDDRGVESKQFHVRDGQGVALLLRAGIEVGFISARASAAVRRRAKELGVRLVRQRVRDKLQAYSEIKRARGLRDEAIAYVGDDLVASPARRRIGQSTRSSPTPGPLSALAFTG